MKDETKSAIQICLSMLKTTLQSEGVIVGAMIDKSDMEKTKLVFLDKQEYIKGKKDGFTVEFSSLNNNESEEKK